MDDIERYIATFDDAEREELALADVAIDIARLLHRAREHRGLSQAAAARRAGMHQQAVSRLEQPGANVQLATLQTYLRALGYVVEINIVDPETGDSAARMVLPPPASVGTAPAQP